MKVQVLSSAFVYNTHMKQFILKNKLLILVFIFVLIGFGIRFYGLFASEFFRDESFSALVSQKSFSGIIQTISTDSSAPLLYFIQHVFGELFGYTTFTMRLPSFIASIFGLIYFWKLLRILNLKRSVKYFLIILFCINPPLIYYGYEARFYGIFITVFIYQVYLLTSIWKKKQITLSTQIKFIISSLIGIYDHNLYSIILVIWGFGAIYYLVNRIKIDGKTIIFKILWPFLAIIILFLPWVPILIGQFREGGNGNWLQFYSFNSLFLTLYQFSFWPAWLNPNHIQAITIAAAILGSVMIILLIIGIIRSFTLPNKRSFLKYAVIFIFVLTVFFIVSLKMPIFYIRYLSFLIPLFLLLIGVSLDPFKKKVSYFIMAIIITLTGWTVISLSFPKSNMNINVTSAISEINSITLTDNNTLIVNKDALTYFNMEFYGQPEYTSYIYDPTLSTPTWVGTSVIPKDRFITTISDNYDKIFVITDSGLTQQLQSEISSQNYKREKQFDYYSNLQLFVFSK